MGEGECEITDVEEVVQLRIQARRVHAQTLGTVLLLITIALGL